jgi:hypothetical protein
LGALQNWRLAQAPAPSPKKKAPPSTAATLKRSFTAPLGDPRDSAPGDVGPGWLGSPSTFKEMSWSGSANKHISNSQEVPRYNSASDALCPFRLKTEFTKQSRKLAKMERKAAAAKQKQLMTKGKNLLWSGAIQTRFGPGNIA